MICKDVWHGLQAIMLNIIEIGLNFCLTLKKKMGKIKKDRDVGPYFLKKYSYNIKLMMKFLNTTPPPPPPVLPIMAHTGRLRPKEVLFTLQVYKRVGISQVEAYKRVGKSVI